MPTRTCIGCRHKFEQNTLFRIGIDKEKATLHIVDGPCVSRSAYLCKDENCVETGLKKDALSRTLRTPITAQAKKELEEILRCKLR